MEIDKIKINPNFKNIIPPLTADEYNQLEINIKTEGCRDALVLWNGFIVDGHNRFEICKKHNIEFKTIELNLTDSVDVYDWIDKNQLGRRNLTPDQATIFRGRIYNRMKRQNGGHGDHRSGCQNDAPKKMSEIIGSKYGVSSRTILRDGQIATYLEQRPDDCAAVMRGEKKMTDIRREIAREGIKKKLENIKTKEIKEIEGVYDVIIIDPPWPMKKIELDIRPLQVEFDYPTMTEEEISALKIPCADDCHVFLWTTQKFIPMAFRLFEKWKIKYVMLFVWHKPGGFQPFGLPQYNAEFVLYGRKGVPKFIDTKEFSACFQAPRGKHSEKPKEFYDTIRRVTCGRRLDMFSRRKIDGFDAWGLEADV